MSTMATVRIVIVLDPLIKNMAIVFFSSMLTSIFFIISEVGGSHFMLLFSQKGVIILTRVEDQPLQLQLLK